MKHGRIECAQAARYQHFPVCEVEIRMIEAELPVLVSNNLRTISRELAGGKAYYLHTAILPYTVSVYNNAIEAVTLTPAHKA